MAKAAHDAGIETVVLASEPQCVLANYLDLLQQSTEELPISLTVDDYILIVDLGCGTADFVLYRIKEDLQVSTRLETDEKFSGALCGSIRVNEQLLEKVMPGEAELQGVLDRLQVSKEGLEWHLLQSIEKAKTDRKYPLWHKITALGPDNGEDYGCKISRQDLEDAQDDSITRIKGIMDNLTGINNHRPNKPKLILVAGGYRKSPYLMGKLKKRYDKPEHRVVNCSDRKNPEETMVCDGGLSVRYSMVAEQSLPTRLGYALLRDDTVSKKRHPDCYLSGRGDRILRKTRFSGWDNKTKVTIDRLHIILPKGVTVGNQPIVDQFDHEFCCHPNQGFIEVHNRFVAFSGDYTEDNSALEDNHDAARSDNPLRHDIYEWAAISLTIPEQALIDRRFPKLRDDEGQEYYKFKANIILKYEGEDNITITWQIKTPSGQNFKEPWTVKGEESVWSARASEFTIEHDPGIEGDGVDSLEA
ncbi:hypothetical protein DOTSEDRAFT_72124 [Dothistroma septosporum NZE10]|uniref:Uncharacterized protein n=1 Tax=Dothistroma septosporum (strain NZE10 / CBS 128990) TaxID=675120 RepID=N1PNR4_DOTSN|nr:hypothetical protein DOTSEDRAFT_72124 [Dothistroma septosporum NZE10]